MRAWAGLYSLHHRVLLGIDTTHTVESGVLDARKAPLSGELSAQAD